MTSYNKSTDFAVKDVLLTGNPNKLVKGSEVDVEFNNMELADATNVKKTGNTGSAVIPTGTTAQRDAAPAVGYTRVNTSTGTLEWWNGTIWTSANGGDAYDIEVTTAIDGQTVITTANNFIVGSNTLMVYVNGLLVNKTTDYTETTTTSFTFNSGLTAGDEVVAQIWRTNISTSGDAMLVSYLPAGTGAVATTVQAKLRESVSVKDFGAVGDGVTDDTAAIQAALTTSKRVYFPAGTYKITSGLTATVDHVLCGDGFTKTTISYSGTSFAITIAAPVADSYASLNLDQFAIAAKNGVQVGGTRASQPTDGAIIGGRINVRVIGTYSSGSGDTAYDTDKVRDTGNTLVSSASGTSLSARKTFDDVEAYGVGIRLSKCMDTVIEFPQFYGNGVSVVLLGSDLVKWRGGRVHEVGLFFYSERIGSWGSQAEIRGVDMLHNRRAGGILLNGTKFDRADDCYYECYSNSALLVFAEETEGVLVDDNRIDDPYYTGGGGTASATTPIILFNTPGYNNKVRGTRFQKFSSFSVAIPSVRVTGSLASIDTNHTEAVAIEPASGYAPIRYKDVQFGMRYGQLNKAVLTPNNMALPIAGNIGPLAVLDGTRYVFFNAAAAFPTGKFELDAIKTAYTLRVNAKTASGVTIFFTVTHNSYDGTLLNTLFGSTIGGFNAATYSAQTQALTLTTMPTQGDYIAVTWQSNTAYIAGIGLE